MWIFSSCGNAGPEGLGNGNLEMFKGDPLKALAREICQNSLDACRDENLPVRVEFKLHEVRYDDFPGMRELESIVDLCADYWKDDKNKKTKIFFENAKSALNQSKLKVLRISDYNTKGLKGAFDKNSKFTPWSGLVKSSGVSVKESENAGGSYGIGKNAPFVNSYVQTVFYRTFSEDGVRAAQGVANLASFIDESYEDENPLRRSLGFYGDKKSNPLKTINELDDIYDRKEYGTDIFVPAFKLEEYWVDAMIGEILDNFLMSVYNGKLVVTVGNEELNSTNISTIMARRGKYVKEAKGFYEVLKAKDGELIDINEKFSNLGNLHLRLLYKNDLNQKILVVRNSGMKIAEIPRLPKAISFSGILELQGDALNSFFRAMETPQHDKWEPKRHPTDPVLAKERKETLESWVRAKIEEKILESVGAEDDIETYEFFNGEKDGENRDDGESLIDRSATYDFSFQQKSTRKYRSTGRGNQNTENGFVDDEGDATGYRHRTGKNGGDKTGRRALINPLGPDSIKTGSKKVGYKARVVKDTKNTDKLIIRPNEKIKDAIIEIETVGENGITLPLTVVHAASNDAKVYCKNGKIYIDEVEADQRVVISFELSTHQEFALGVRVYGNKE